MYFSSSSSVNCSATGKVYIALPSGVTISAVDATAIEPSTNTTAKDKATFRITRSDTTKDGSSGIIVSHKDSPELNVYFSVSGTATVGLDYLTSGDYRDTNGMFVTIPSGSTYTDFTITPKYDTLTEGSETVIVTLEPHSSYTVGSPSVDAIAIMDPLPVVTVTAAEPTATEPLTDTIAGENGTFIFSRTDSTASDLTVYYSVSGTATSARDYISIGSSVIIPAGSDSVSINVTPKYDTLTEDNETVTVTLSANSAYTIGTPKAATVTIKDPPPIITVIASDATATEPSSDTEATDNGTFTFTRTGSTASALTIQYSVSGTAEQGADFASIGTAITFPIGAASITRNVIPKYDTLTEDNETVIVTLTPYRTNLPDGIIGINLPPEIPVFVDDDDTTQPVFSQYVIDNPYRRATVTIKDNAQALVNPTVKCTLTPAGAVAAGAMWRLDDGGWNANDDMVSTTAGNHTISFKNADGYTSPNSQTFTLAIGEAKVMTAIYTKVQNVVLKAGWNWISFHVLPESHKVKDVLGTEGFTLNDRIQTGSSVTSFIGTGWISSGNTVDYGKLYQIYVAKDVTVNLAGQENRSNALSVVSGWNWLGNPMTVSLTPAQLSHSIGFTAGDRIQSGDGSNIIYSGNKWIPSTGFMLEPGKGYQFYLQKAGTVTFGSDE